MKNCPNCDIALYKNRVVDGKCIACGVEVKA